MYQVLFHYVSKSYESWSHLFLLGPVFVRPSFCQSKISRTDICCGWVQWSYDFSLKMMWFLWKKKLYFLDRHKQMKSNSILLFLFKCIYNKILITTLNLGIKQFKMKLCFHSFSRLIWKKQSDDQLLRYTYSKYELKIFRKSCTLKEHTQLGT